MSTPRVFIVRHGETEWSLNGRHTSTTDLPLTHRGRGRIIQTGRALIGPSRLIVPSNLAHIYVSPLSRAQQTLQLLHSHLPSQVTESTTTPLITEWNYGNYEGLLSKEIRERRGGKWDIWTDGCEGGESPEQVAERCDEIIREIRERWHNPAFNGEGKGDVMVVAHGHLLRAFAMRWIGRELGEKLTLVLEAGGVGTLSYEHNNIDEPAILLGGAFVGSDEQE
ncbi:phosphoglycerate mutase family protein [Pyronema domesticum]|uniref:Similar to Sedoheptulose 1,7-bisphosphatase acc. no. P36136 n=1 Tax=Pyronema omphalodes (strain CBS 100304) TaxID=1076935 RepID=U4L7C3_PYROM|nr:phosphoglycerate mutase family protein [Pyronema domesticum]CCX08599.1 Similar to Sedoheptulose 1,7-bisphosphatase; acc. no. P36136 [Pyronema omphalodes CBS 100304]